VALPPYPGQGSPLPEETPYDGEWVIEGEVFIFRTDPPGALGESAGIMRPDGTECDGFDADDLAEQLQVSTAKLFDLNRRGLLFVEYRDKSLLPGTVRMREFDFKTPARGMRFTIGAVRFAGKA
jgi:hypothetical protein